MNPVRAAENGFRWLMRVYPARFRRSHGLALFELFRDEARAAHAARGVRGLAAVFLDPAATEHEKANAKILKGRLEKQLSQEATPESKWTGIMFRLGQGVKEITSAPSPKADWTDHAFRLGRMLRRGFKR